MGDKEPQRSIRRVTIHIDTFQVSRPELVSAGRVALGGTIALLFNRHCSSVRGILTETGGIRPRTRHRSLRALSLGEREDVAAKTKRAGRVLRPAPLL